MANLGNLLAPALLIFFITSLYSKYKDLPRLKGAFSMIQLAVFAMVISVGFQLIKIKQLMHVTSLLVVVASFFILIYTKIHPAFVIIGAGLIGAFLGK